MLLEHLKLSNLLFNVISMCSEINVTPASLLEHYVIISYG